MVGATPKGKYASLRQFTLLEAESQEGVDAWDPHGEKEA